MSNLLAMLEAAMVRSSTASAIGKKFPVALIRSACQSLAASSEADVLPPMLFEFYLTL